MVPAAVKEVVPHEQLAYLAENPLALLSAEARDQLEAGFTLLGAQGAGLLDALRQALSSAIGEVFLISLVVAAAAWIATLLLRPAPTEPKDWRGGRAGNRRWQYKAHRGEASGPGSWIEGNRGAM